MEISVLHKGLTYHISLCIGLWGGGWWSIQMLEVLKTCGYEEGH